MSRRNNTYAPAEHYNIKLTDWSQFSSNLDDNIKNDPELWPPNDIGGIDSLDNITSKLTSHFKHSITVATPKHRDTGNHKPRLPPLALTLIRTRRKIKNDHIRQPTDTRRQQINELNKTIKHIIKETRKAIDANKGAILAQGPRNSKFWPIIRQTLKPLNNQTHPLVFDNTYASKPEDKLKIFRSLYEDILIDNNINHNAQSLDDPNFNITHSVQYYMNKRTNHLQYVAPDPEDLPHPLLTKITLNEIAGALDNTKNNKAPGPDMVRYEHVKKAPVSAIQILLNIYNASLTYAYFPKHFKTCIVTLIPKPNKDPTKPTSYRPITLSPIFSKLLEKIINNRLLNASLANKIIKPYQTAFLPKRGTEHNILKVLQHTANNFNSNRFTLIVSTDIKQAFDRAWHAGLIATLSSYCPHNFLLLIKSFLTNRQLFFRLDKTNSTWFITPNRGMPQGSPLSPLLFNIIMSTAPEINTRKIGTYNYADDTFFTSSAITPRLAWQQIKQHIDNFIKWSNRNKLTIQPDKTTAVFLTRRRATPLHLFPNINIQNATINNSPSIKILGLTFDTHLSFRQHITNITNGSHVLINSIRQLMSNSPNIPPFIGLLLYKTLIRTRLTYAAPAFLLIKPTSWRAMASLEHRALRAAFRKGIRTKLTKLYKLAKLDPLQDHYNTVSKATINRIITNGNHSLVDLMFKTQPQLNRIFTYPPLDKAFDLFPLNERSRLAKLIESTLNNTT